MNVSVIMPVYNAVAFLEKAVNSALSLEEVGEILLIEDGSRDDSLELCKKLSSENSKIKLYQHSDKGNHGAGASRNLGLENASQEFIAFLDADDYYLQNRFEAERELFKNPKTEGVFGAIGKEFLTEKGKIAFEKKFKNVALTTVNYGAEGKEVFLGLLGLNSKTFGTFFHLNALTIRNASLKKNNLRFNQNLRVHQDSDFIIKLSHYCYLKSGIIDKAVAIRGVHDDNRITKIVKFSEIFNSRQLLLWQSLYDWAETVKITENAKKEIWLQKSAFLISSKRGVRKYMLLLKTILKNPTILKTKYRFTYLQR